MMMIVVKLNGPDNKSKKFHKIRQKELELKYNNIKRITNVLLNDLLNDLLKIME